MAGKPAILLTRPAGRGERLQLGLEARGFQVLHVPCLDLEPVHFQHQPAEIAALDTFSLVIVVSPTAAQLGLELVDRYWPQWPLRQIWLATGRQTASVLEETAAGPGVIFPGPDSESAEGLLALPELAEVAGCRILVLKGCGGREVLREELQRRGALVSELALYRRTCPEGQEAVLQQAIAAGSFGMSVVLSGATLDNLLALSGGLATQLRKVPICVPGNRLAGIARERGFRSVVPAVGAGTDALLQTIEEWWRVQAQ